MSLVWNKNDRVVVAQPLAANSAEFNLRGGKYYVETASTGAGTIDLTRKNTAGTFTATLFTQVVAVAGRALIELPEGAYRLTITGFTLTTVEFSRLPSSE